MTKKNIFVSQPFLPHLDEFIPYLNEIWDSKILTNSGSMHQKLEQELCRYLGVNYISLFSNATIALIVVLRALKIEGEVITTPYSFIATSHSIMWAGLKPVFVDIDPWTLNLDPKKIESAITDKTTAIMPVHCYGVPCDVRAINEIASRNKLKVIYDAAHAFGVKDENGSILLHGDLSVLSFHATKIFNTFEGGAVISHDLETKEYIDKLKNFGFENEISISEVGINGKMNEISAAFGLLHLSHMDELLEKRKEIDSLYRSLLHNLKGIECLNERFLKSSNFSYFPILIDELYPTSRDQLYERLRAHGVFARRYFYPLISNFSTSLSLDSANKAILKVANEVADRILCLPMHAGLIEDDVFRITDIIRQ